VARKEGEAVGPAPFTDAPKGAIRISPTGKRYVDPSYVSQRVLNVLKYQPKYRSRAATTDTLLPTHKKLAELGAKMWSYSTERNSRYFHWQQYMVNSIRRKKALEMQPRKRTSQATTDELMKPRDPIKTAETGLWLCSKSRREDYFKRQYHNAPRRLENLFIEFAENQKLIPKIHAYFQTLSISENNRRRSCIMKRILNWRQEFTPGQFLPIEQNSHWLKTLRHASYAAPCGKISRRTLLFWRAMKCYDRLYPKTQRKRITFEPIMLPPSKFITVHIENSPHQNFQGGIKVSRETPRRSESKVIFG
jgi:hypothetical protein